MAATVWRVVFNSVLLASCRIVGRVVDDSIVVVGDIERLLSYGDERRQATAIGSFGTGAEATLPAEPGPTEGRNQGGWEFSGN